jgi:hypothetical protein
MKSIFKTDKRIKLGIWGLGRGMSFYQSCRALNFDIVAGCDYNLPMRENFARLNPDATVTEDAEKFLAMDMDAVLLATYCPAHADDAIKCLQAGKHVLSEVTSFHTMAEGVRLVEAVEKSGLVYNLAENYPFSAANMWLARKWKEGFFGDLMYGEYEYVHECRVLAYVYIDGTPINPGNQTHSWRSWLNYHYYNTHSLGPMMHITGLRPTRVAALPATVTLSAYPMDALRGMGGIAPSLINMSNGSVVRNLMGATTNDTHQQRIWGTNAAAEIIDGKLRVRVGAAGHGRMVDVSPRWDDLGDIAARTGHGGGDFWVLCYFARNILFGEPGPFDIYKASDCTIPGLLAFRSSTENGKPYDIPDFRDRKQRDAWRNDHFAQPRFDHREGLFPKKQDLALTTQFSRTIRDLMGAAFTYRAYRDARLLAEDLSDPTQILAAAEAHRQQLVLLQESQAVAKQIIDRYPDSVGGRVLRDMYQQSDPEITGRPDYARLLAREIKKLNPLIARIAKKRTAEAERTTSPWKSGFASSWQISKLFPKTKLELADVNAKTFKQSGLGWKAMATDSQFHGLANIHDLTGGKDGVILMTATCSVSRPMALDLLIGYDGGIKLFVDNREVLFDGERMNPAVPDRNCVPVHLSRGKHRIGVALDTAEGNGWGAYLRFGVPKSLQKKCKNSAPVFPRWIQNK